MPFAIRLLAAALIFCGFFATSSSLASYGVRPMVFELAPSGAKSATMMTINSTSKRPVTVEYKAVRVEIDENGGETLTPADKDFLIFPPQSIIQPGRSQAVRIKYVGNPQLQSSVTYRIRVQQVAVAMDPTVSGVGINVNFSLLGTVVPPGARPDLVVESSAPSARPGIWDVVVVNRGQSYARLSNTTWTFRDQGGREEVIGGVRLKAQNVSNIVLPGHKLRVGVKAPGNFNPATTRISIEAKENQAG